MRLLGILAGLAGIGVSISFPAWALDSVGTGFFVNSDGWIVTNAHVVEGCGAVEVAGYGPSQELHVDATNDLAAIRVPADSHTFLSFRRKPPRLGEEVAAMGYPLSTLLSDSVKITKGNINSLVGIENDTRFLQVSTPIQPGNSGGPLLDNDGRVLGVTTATLSLGVALATGSLPQNVNFAIRGIVVETFLQSYGIHYDHKIGAVQLSTADLAEQSSPAIVPILCELEGDIGAQIAASESDASEKPNALEIRSVAQRAEEFVNRIQFEWSLPNSESLSSVETLYTTPLDYYGEWADPTEVHRDKRAFAERWPIRDYSARPDSLAIECSGSKCSVSGVVDWFAHSPERGKAADGVANFSLVVDVDREIILSESSSVRSGLDADPAQLLMKWEILNSGCRGGSGDENSTWTICDWREDASASLKAADWCYGRESEYGYQHEWHKCEQLDAGETFGLTGYPSQVAARVRDALTYPAEARGAGLTGEVHVTFTLGRDGSVSSVQIARSSGLPILDQAAVATIWNAAPFPPFPANERRYVWPFTVPLTFTR